MSSDSDDSGIAKKSKSTGVRARRGFAKKVTDVSSISESSSIYSSRAAQCFKDIGDHNVKITVPLGTDVEGDVVLGRLKKSYSAPAQIKSDVLFLSDDDEEENCDHVQSTPTGKGDGITILSPTPPRSPPPPPDTSAQGKRKRGGRRGKQQKQLDQAVSNITKNVSDAQRLLKTSDRRCDSPEKDVCIVDEDDELTVRIEHRDRIQRYQLQATEHFSGIITQIADKEGVATRCVMLVYNDHTLRPTETPQSIQFRAGDIIECHLVDSTEDSFLADGDEEMIELLLQRQGSRQRETMKAHKDETLSVLINKYASIVGEEASNLQAFFDGDYVNVARTPSDLEMEDGDILDIKVVT